MTTSKTKLNTDFINANSAVTTATDNENSNDGDDVGVGIDDGDATPNATWITIADNDASNATPNCTDMSLLPARYDLHHNYEDKDEKKQNLMMHNLNIMRMVSKHR